ncbi:MAG: hypothetical protein PHV42_04090 [Candidatus Pacebacteria bacterium]|nr:hypothetical protein [Candidatus Paceibacterota bacterium]
MQLFEQGRFRKQFVILCRTLGAHIEMEAEQDDALGALTQIMGKPGLRLVDESTYALLTSLGAEDVAIGDRLHCALHFMTVELMRHKPVAA